MANCSALEINKNGNESGRQREKVEIEGEWKERNKREKEIKQKGLEPRLVEA